MSLSVLDLDHMVSIIAFLVAMTVGFFLLRRKRIEHARRTQELIVAGRALEAHRRFVAEIVSDPATPEIVRDFLTELSLVSGSKVFAHAVSRGRVETPLLTGDRQNYLDALVAAVQELVRHRQDLARDIMFAMATALAGTMLRWPPHELAGVDVLQLEQRVVRPKSIHAEVRQEARRIVNAMPNLCHAA